MVVERHKLKCDLKVGERMIIFWQHFFIVIVEASSSPCSPSSPHVSSFSTFLYARTCVRNYCGVPTVPFVPAPLFITFFCIGERLQFQRERSTIVPFAALKSRVIIVLAAHTESLFGSSITSLRSRSQTFNYQPVSSHPAAEYHCTDCR